MVLHMHVGFIVEDYARWRAGYDASIEQRKASGEISYQVFQDVSNPNVVSVLSVQSSAERVQAFIDSPDLQKKMKASGITKMGTMLIGKEVGSGTH